jgi:hypothetical protein
MLQNAVAEWVAVLVVELLEMVNIEDDQGYAIVLAGEGLLK